MVYVFIVVSVLVKTQFYHWQPEWHVLYTEIANYYLLLFCLYQLNSAWLCLHCKIVVTLNLYLHVLNRWNIRSDEHRQQTVFLFPRNHVSNLHFIIFCQKTLFLVQCLLSALFQERLKELVVPFDIDHSFAESQCYQSLMLWVCGAVTVSHWFFAFSEQIIRRDILLTAVSWRLCVRIV